MKVRIPALAALILIGSVLLNAGVSVDSDSLLIKDRGMSSEFSGNVTITGENFSVKSAKAVSDTRTGIITASGDVHIKYSSGTLRMERRSGRARIDDGEKKFYLFNDVKSVLVSGDSPPAEAGSETVEVDYLYPGKAVFAGGVNVVSEEMRITSEEAVYRGEHDTVLFTGSPSGRSIAQEALYEYSGEVITVFLESSSVVIEGDAGIRIWVKDEPEM